MSALCDLSLVELRAGLDQRKFSAREVLDSCLSRAEAQQALNAFLQLLPDSSRQSAKAADDALQRGERKPLLGIPVALKDNILAKGSRTTCASKILGNFESPYNATVTEKLLNDGALIFGKTNLDEFAMGSSNENSAFGPVRNAWDTSRVPGGSSGGSATAVAARIVPAALGTDTGGSVRQPASLSGVYGLKPTYGRVSRYGVVAFASSLDQVGCFARTIQDLALLASCITGHDRFDSTSVDQPIHELSQVLSRGVKGLRIGVPKEYFIGGVSPEVEHAVHQSIETLRTLGASIVDISLPHTEHSVGVYYVVASAEASSNLARFDGVRYGYRAKDAKDLKELYLRSRSEGFGDEVKRRIMVGSFVLSTGYFDAYYLHAQKVRALIANDFKEAFEKHCDVIACPVSPSTAFSIGEKTSDPLAMYLSDVFTIPANLAGLPAMSVPCGFDSHKLPIGLHLIAKPWDESTLFQVAGAYEQATEWYRQIPPTITHTARSV